MASLYKKTHQNYWRNPVNNFGVLSLYSSSPPPPLSFCNEDYYALFFSGEMISTSVLFPSWSWCQQLGERASSGVQLATIERQAEGWEWERRVAEKRRERGAAKGSGVVRKSIWGILKFVECRRTTARDVTRRRRRWRSGKKKHTMKQGGER